MLEAINHLLSPLENRIKKLFEKIKIFLLFLAALSLILVFIPSFQKDTGEWALNLLWIILFFPIVARVFGVSIVQTLLPLRRELGILMGTLAWVHSVNYILQYPTIAFHSYFWWNGSFFAYFAIGFIALFFVTPLLLTSNEWAVKKLGRHWKTLHQLVYAVLIFTVLHVELISMMNRERIDYGILIVMFLYLSGKLCEWFGISLVPKKVYPKGQKFRCIICGFIYDPKIGDPDGGISPGTEFSDIPDSWKCPECGVTKADFVPFLEGDKFKTKEVLVKDVRYLNPTTLELIIESSDPLISIPGQFITFVLEDENGNITRPYSIVSTEADKIFTFTIKLTEYGRGAKILRKIENGSRLKILGVAGRFLLKNSINPKIFIATGTGLGPVYRMIQALGGKQNIKLYFSVSTEAELFYVDKLRTIPLLELHIHITKENISGYEIGRVDTDSIEASAETEWYLCGNPQMIKESKEKLVKKGYKYIYTEQFH